MTNIVGRRVAGSGSSPSQAIDPVVKLRCTGPGFAEQGTGFVLSEPGWGNFVLTARHVVWRPSAKAKMIQVIGQAADGSDVPLLAQSVAHDTGATAAVAFDTAIVCIAHVPTVLFGLLAAEPPFGAFGAEIRGFKGSSSSLTSKTIPVANWDTGTRTITYGAAIQGFGGYSGGPLVFGGRVVGIHATANSAAELHFDPDLNTIMMEAWNAR